VEDYLAGTLAGAGSFSCQDCSFAVALLSLDRVPECPNCGSTHFQRASIFADGPPVDHPARGHEAPDWLTEIRDGIEDPGHFIAFEDGERATLIPLGKEWTRVGRSAAADIRLDDPTVSRRHALIVRQSEGVRVLDDRSLNGVFLNDERVDWHALSDGDELLIGRFSLYFIDTTGDRDAAAESSEAEAALA
jgi:FHA domain/Zinc-ribbon containing domain